MYRECTDSYAQYGYVDYTLCRPMVLWRMLMAVLLCLYKATSYIILYHILCGIVVIMSLSTPRRRCSAVREMGKCQGAGCNWGKAPVNTWQESLCLYSAIQLLNSILHAWCDNNCATVQCMVQC